VRGQAVTGNVRRAGKREGTGEGLQVKGINKRNVEEDTQRSWRRPLRYAKRTLVRLHSRVLISNFCVSISIRTQLPCRGPYPHNPSLLSRSLALSLSLSRALSLSCLLTTPPSRPHPTRSLIPVAMLTCMGRSIRIHAEREEFY